MDYSKLADLLYPFVTLTLDDCLKKYPKRNLPEGAEVMRFAPSPTGFFHVGGLYSSLISRMSTWKNGGVFYLRIEDTDQKREIKGSGDIIVDSLDFFDVSPDEGYQGEDKQDKGAYGPYVQSKRLELYHAFAKELVRRGRAFPCFCQKTESKEDVLERRNEQLENEEEITGHDVCRELSYEQIEQNIREGKPFALRLLSVGDDSKTFEFVDRAKGKREVRQNTKDIVLVKSNGVPPYSLAHVVDDTLMGTTTVVRGEEWWASLAAHLEVFEALGLKAPRYLHTPVTCKLDDETGNKRKLSKRKDPESDIRFYIQNGYPKVSVIEYLLNLLNSDFEQWRTKNPSLDYKDFDFSLDKIGSNNPMFDIVKLNDYAKTYISKLTAVEVYENVLSWAESFDKTFANYLKENKDYAIKVLNIDREIPKPRKDIATYSEVKSYFAYMFLPFGKDRLEFELDGIDTKKLTTVLAEYKNYYNENDDKQAWFARIKEMAEVLGYATDNKAYKLNPENYPGNTSDVCTFIRLAVCGKKNSPDLWAICNILGKDEVINRLNNLINLVK